MIYHHLFQQLRKQDKVQAAIIGAGHFGTAVVTQQKYTPYLAVTIVADKKTENAKNAFLRAEIPEDKIVYCNDAVEAEKEIANGNYVYTDEPMMIMDVKSIDVVCEGTGVPEAGAVYSKLAIEKGKHVAAINKELDSAVGPILRKLAEEHGVVYTQVDGDQPALLIEMVEWARAIGLTVISAGKARDGEFIYDEKNHTISIKADGITVHEDYEVKISEENTKYFKMIPEGKAEEYLNKRASALKDLPNAGAFDLCELTVIANATGLKPAVSPLTKGTLRITELPVAYCAKKNNGIYDNEGIIDVLTCLRRSDESGMGGGVYLVVRCDNAYSNYILTTKGQIANYDCSTAVIYRPYHLCGVEVSTSILCAGLLGMNTSSTEYKPSFDLVKRATRDILSGEVLGNDHDLKMEALIIPTTIRGKNNAVPGHLLDGNIVVKDIKVGEIITYSMIECPVDSELWKLRELQEKTF